MHSQTGGVGHLLTWRVISSFMVECLTTSALLFCSAGGAMACSPGKQFNARFPSASDQLSGSEAGRLGAWVAQMQRDYPNRAMFLLVGYVGKAGTEEELARRREAWVREFLVRMGEDDKTIVWGGTTVYRPEDVGKYSNITPSSIAIDFLPACPHECCKR